MITATTASSSEPPSPALASSSSASASIDCATIVFSTVFGSASDMLEPSARNSNLLPVKANGDVRLRSPPCIGSAGSTDAPRSRWLCGVSPSNADIIAACKRLPLKKRSRITFEYVLLAGVNDRPQDARRLAKLLSGVHAKVNLIPLNEAPGIPFSRPSDRAVDAFAKVLADRDIIVSVRKSRGRDIRAACGQLIVDGQRKSPAQQLAVLM